MCNIDDPPASAVVAEALSDKQQSLANPDGVQFMDHLWQLIEDIDQPLTVVLRTESDIFDDVPVKAFWLHIPAAEDRRYTVSRLAFDLPDEVCRRIQSKHAQQVRARFFGDTGPVDLPEVFRSPHKRDGVRQPQFHYRKPPVVLQDDWPALKEAIRLSAQDSAMQLGGQRVSLNDGSESVAPARVNDSRLEVLIDYHLVSSINWQWNGELGNLLGVKNRMW